jgi:hypothetical protein
MSRRIIQRMTVRSGNLVFVDAFIMTSRCQPQLHGRGINLCSHEMEQQTPYRDTAIRTRR